MLLPIYQIKGWQMTEDYNNCERRSIKSKIIQYKLYLLPYMYSIFESLFQDTKIPQILQNGKYTYISRESSYYEKCNILQQ
jgi:hypothetical protein